MTFVIRTIWTLPAGAQRMDGTPWLFRITVLPSNVDDLVHGRSGLETSILDLHLVDNSRGGRRLRLVGACSSRQ